MNFDITTDVAIIGAGPAGSSTSIFLSKAGISHVIFDKELFPRDKICGDALSGKSVRILKNMEMNIISEMEKDTSHFLDSWGVRFVAPNGKGVDIPFTADIHKEDHAPGFIVRRYYFDNFLINHIDDQYGDKRLGYKIKNVDFDENGAIIQYEYNGKEGFCRAKVVIGAGGDRSIMAKKIAGHKIEAKHYIGGVRAYYKNVSGFYGQNFIELHFIKEALPGYLWIFPMAGNEANVGLGMLKKDMQNKNVNLKKILKKALAENETIKSRFENAELIDDIKGWGLPLGSKKRDLAGERYLLVGDAASLIDPFSGEGIGNALFSGKVAAGVVQEALRENDFSYNFLSRYNNRIYNELAKELNLSFRLQQLVRFPWLFNFLMDRLQTNDALRDMVSHMFTDLDMRAKLKSPSFYMKLLFS